MLSMFVVHEAELRYREFLSKNSIPLSAAVPSSRIVFLLFELELLSKNVIKSEVMVRTRKVARAVVISSSTRVKPAVFDNEVLTVFRCISSLFLARLHWEILVFQEYFAKSLV